MSKVTIDGWVARDFPKHNGRLRIFNYDPEKFEGFWIAPYGTITLNNEMFPEVKKGMKVRATITIELESDE